MALPLGRSGTVFILVSTYDWSDFYKESSLLEISLCFACTLLTQSIFFDILTYQRCFLSQLVAFSFSFCYLKIYFSFIYVCLCMHGYVHINGIPAEARRGYQSNLELELGVVSSPAWALGFEPRSPIRAVHARNCWPISPNPVHQFSDFIQAVTSAWVTSNPTHQAMFFS